jgi:hypothetical protein
MSSRQRNTVFALGAAAILTGVLAASCSDGESPTHAAPAEVRQEVKPATTDSTVVTPQDNGGIGGGGGRGPTDSTGINPT